MAKKKKKKAGKDDYHLCQETGKRGFKNEADARVASAQLGKKRAGSRLYTCPFCGYVHLTTQRKRS